jgi:biopolymer transport protein ExbB
MKKFLSILAIGGMLAMIPMQNYAQGDPTGEPATEETQPDAPIADEAPVAEEAPAAPAGEEKPENTSDVSLQQTLKEQFINGGPEFMAIVLVCLIIGLALAIERIVYLNMAGVNTRKLLNQIENALNAGGVEKAKEVCRNTRGPVASVFYQGLDRYKEGLDNAEKSIQAYGSVQMGLLEKGLSWIALFIALAPMLGFMGTVIGMIQSFETIEEAETIVISEVAKGIKVALLTTVFGLIVAIILQIFYNYIVAKIDGLVNQMEDASISLIDLLIKFQEKNSNA